MLLAAMARLQLRQPAHLLRVQTFGSPPVLAHQPVSGSSRRSTTVLQVLRHGLHRVFLASPSLIL